MKNRFRFRCLVLAFPLVILAACSSSTTSTEVTDTVAVVETVPVVVETGFPTEFDVSEPLVAKPPTGKKVGWLECAVPACQQYTQGFADATKALGWDLETITLDHTGPAGAFQRAIDAKVDYIVSTAQSAALIDEQLQAAKAAGIPYFSLFGEDVPNPAVNNIVIQAGGAKFYVSQGEALGDWVTKDSGGSAKVVYVNIRDLKILNYAEQGLGNKIKSDCTGCTFDVLPVTFADLGGGTIPQIVASYLQTHPDTNYVLFAFSDLIRGVSQTLKDAGLGDGIKLGGTINDALNTQAIVDGTESGWTAQAVDYMSWLAVDAMARVSVGMPLDQAYLDAILVIPTFVITKATASKLLTDSAGLWSGPVGFREHFTKMWKS